jgi:hypothetical protein
MPPNSPMRLALTRPAPRLELDRLRLLRRLSNADFVQSLIGWLTASYIRLVHATSRWEVRRSPAIESYWQDGRPFIGVFWHGRFLMMPFAWRPGLPVHMLISRHRDGEFIARTIGHFGLRTIRGSARRGQRDKGGGGALRAMLKALAANEYIAITPDGPKGPRMRVNPGAVLIAKLSGAPIVPATYSTRRGRLFNSWDRFLLPWPFGRGIFILGEPIYVPTNAEGEALEVARQEVENELNRMTAEADRLCGHPPVLPAPFADADDSTDART